MPASLIPARAPAVTELMQARKVLVALQEYLETPEGMKLAGADFVDLHSAITMVTLTTERLTHARAIP
jgi:hypothetical protein